MNFVMSTGKSVAWQTPWNQKTRSSIHSRKTRSGAPMSRMKTKGNRVCEPENGRRSDLSEKRFWSPNHTKIVLRALLYDWENINHKNRVSESYKKISEKHIRSYNNFDDGVVNHTKRRSFAPVDIYIYITSHIMYIVLLDCIVATILLFLCFRDRRLYIMAINSQL